MKKIMLTLVAMLTIVASARAMSYEQAREEALFLTDKMAYELNLSDAQYEAAYEINLDYLMGVTSVDDVYGPYWERRNLDLSYILFQWQWDAFRAASYFFRPLYWDAGYWHFGIYARYPHRTYFYFGRPHFFATYRGGHSWHMNGGRSFYEGRRDHYRPGNPTRNQHFGMRNGWDRGDYRGHGGQNSSTHITGGRGGRDNGGYRDSRGGNGGNYGGSFGGGRYGNGRDNGGLGGRDNGGYDNTRGGNGSRSNGTFYGGSRSGNGGSYNNYNNGSRPSNGGSFYGGSRSGNGGSYNNYNNGSRPSNGGSYNGGSFNRGSLPTTGNNSSYGQGTRSNSNGSFGGGRSNSSGSFRQSGTRSGGSFSVGSGGGSRSGGSFNSGSSGGSRSGGSFNSGSRGGGHGGFGGGRR